MDNFPVVESIRVLLVHGQTLVRDALVSALDTVGGIDVVASVEDLAAAQQAVRELSSDLVLVDFDSVGSISLESLAPVLQAGAAKLMFLAADSAVSHLGESLRSRANGLVGKSQPFASLVEGVFRVAAGRSYFPEVQPTSEKHGCLARLTSRELEVLTNIANGHSKKEIGALLHISPKTVENHTDNLMKKLGVHDRVELTRLAIREQLVNP